MTIANALKETTLTLSQLYDKREAKNIAQIAIMHVAKLTSIQLLINAKEELSIQEKAELANIVNALLRHKPIQYITNKAYFYGLELAVNESVLIPRPETEELVGFCLQELNNSTNQDPIIIDIGTGSGCIALALKKQLPNSKITAVDVSEEALGVASKNASNLQLPIHLIFADITNELHWEKIGLTEGKKFDIIISNPPYIAASESQQMEEQVLNYEPHLALFAPKSNSLFFYKHIANFGKQHLANKGFIAVEINENLACQTEKVFLQAGFKKISIIKDMQGKSRILSAKF